MQGVARQAATDGSDPSIFTIATDLYQLTRNAGGHGGLPAFLSSKCGRLSDACQFSSYRICAGVFGDTVPVDPQLQ